jgi:hypothetical protein
MQDSSYTTVPLYRRDGSVCAEALIDTADANAVLEFRWFMDNRGYARSRPPGHDMLWMHRVVLGLRKGDGLEVDHINLNPLDNRRANLRLVTREQQAQNRQPIRGTSRFRGVQWDGEKKRWRARHQLNGRRISLGTFLDEVEAARAAEAWRQVNMPFAQPDPELARRAP